MNLAHARLLVAHENCLPCCVIQITDSECT